MCLSNIELIQFWLVESHSDCSLSVVELESVPFESDSLESSVSADSLSLSLSSALSLTANKDKDKKKREMNANLQHINQWTLNYHYLLS